MHGVEFLRSLCQALGIPPGHRVTKIVLEASIDHAPTAYVVRRIDQERAASVADAVKNANVRVVNADDVTVSDKGEVAIHVAFKESTPVDLPQGFTKLQRPMDFRQECRRRGWVYDDQEFTVNHGHRVVYLTNVLLALPAAEVVEFVSKRLSPGAYVAAPFVG